MNFTEYVNQHRTSKKGKPNGAIVERWQSRILPAQLHMNGEQGAEQYLNQYGKSIGADKCIMFARYAEEHGFHNFAQGMWKKAFGIEFPAELKTLSSKVDAPPAFAPIYADVRREGKTASQVQSFLTKDFPLDMQPGKLVTMQPTDAAHSREYYCESSAYWGQPKRDGNKIVIFASEHKVWYQSRSLNMRKDPNPKLDTALRTAARETGSFIAEGEIYYTDFNGNEHMASATAAQANIQLGHGTFMPVERIALFGVLFINGKKITAKYNQIGSAEMVVEFGRLSTLTAVPTARTKEEKYALCALQSSEKREGEIWIESSLVPVAGKITSSNDPQYDFYARTKYSVGIQRYRVVSVAPTNAEGHFIGGLSIEDTDGKPVGSVGTGYTRSQQAEILRRFTASPNDTWVLVDAQVKTIFGQLRHSRFIDFPEE